MIALNDKYTDRNKNRQCITSYIKHLAGSGLSSVSARIKSTCNLTGKCFEMPNVSYTQPLGVMAKKIRTETGNYMQKTTFKIAKMDCPSEEQMIRMKLNDLTNIKSLEFDIPNRQLTVFHTDNHDKILQRLDNLRFDTTLIDSVAEENFIISTDNTNHERKSLWIVLFINLFFFALEMTTGFISNSMGLVADSLDMFADSIVYGLALLAVGGTMTRKKNITKYAGYFQLTLAFFGLIEVIRRFVGNETVPAFKIMIIISILALIGNGLCLYVLQKSKSNEIHMQASMIFTSNDVIVNLGVILAGGLVYFTNSKYPDLIVGSIVFLIVGQGAFKILKLSK